MKLSPLVTTFWLVWVLFIVSKVSLGLNPTAAGQIFKDFGRAACVLVGSYVARIAADECTDKTIAAFSFAAAIAVVAVAIDAAFKANSGQILRPGTAAVLSAIAIVASELLLRAPESCYVVAAPVIVGSGLLGAALSSVRKHI